MRRLLLSAVLALSLFATAKTNAQHNTCQMAETVLDSLNKMYRADYYDMSVYMDSSYLILRSTQLNDLYAGVFNDKRILLATATEAMPIYACTGFTKMRKDLRPFNPDSIAQKYNLRSAFSRSGSVYANIVGARFSNLLYSDDVAIGYMQLNMIHESPKFYYFLFEKNKQTGNWDMKRLELRTNV